MRRLPAFAFKFCRFERLKLLAQRTNHQQFSAVHGKFSADRGKFSAAHEKFSAAHEKFSADHGKFSADRGKFSADHGKFSADRGKFSADRGKFSADRGKFSADRGKFSADRGKFSADRGKFSADRGKFSADHGKYSAVHRVISNYLGPSLRLFKYFIAVFLYGRHCACSAIRKGTKQSKQTSNLCCSQGSWNNTTHPTLQATLLLMKHRYRHKGN